MFCENGTLRSTSANVVVGASELEDDDDDDDIEEALILFLSSMTMSSDDEDDEEDSDIFLVLVNTCSCIGEWLKSTCQQSESWGQFQQIR